MSLEPGEFILMFSLHILPRGFARFRHYGILSGRKKAYAIPQIILQLEGRTMSLIKHEPHNAPAVLCPCCRKHA
ncbi:MAG: transposase [Bacteroidia bacterium]|nr:transposase [Bacteroidia bacterium]